MPHLTLLILLIVPLFAHQVSQIPSTPTQLTEPTLTTLESLLREANTPRLTLSEKRAIIAAAARVVPSLSVNRFLQLSFYNVDIAPQLTALSNRLESLHNANQTNTQFHAAIIPIFASLRDRHTTYMLPDPLGSAFATLDFSVNAFFTGPGQKRTSRIRYAADDIPVRLSRQNDHFVDGVELVTWNGVPISRVVRKLGKESYGSNKPAQLSNALVSFTLRGLAIDPLPLEPFATIGFVDRRGRNQVAQVPWLFFDLRAVPPARHLAPQSVSRLLSTRNRVTRSARIRPPRHTRTTIPVKKVAAGLVEAELISTQLATVGRLVLPSFDAKTTNELVEELSRILRLMPEEGLILDIRDNFGGQVDFAKSWIELLTNATILPQPQTVRASPLMRRLTKQNVGNSSSLRTFLAAFGPAARTAGVVGELFSGPVDGLFLTGDFPKRLKQVYRGPLVTVMNGLTYSAGDVFAALQIEKGLSLLVGTSDRTGAGGASTVRYSALADTYPRIFKALPGGTDFTCSYTRYFRSGAKQGALMEYFGVEPDERYYSTRNDVLFDEEDFVDFLVSKLKGLN